MSYPQISIGIKTGYTNNHLNTNISNRVFTLNKNGSGLGFGFLGNYEINNRIGIEGSIEFLQKKYSLVRTDKYQGVYETSMNSYLQLPLIIQLKIYNKKKLAINLNGGFYGAYWTFAKIKGAIPNIFNSAYSVDAGGQSIQNLTLALYSERKPFNKLRDNRFEYGWLTGIGVNYNLSKENRVFIKYEYYQSLTDQQKNYMLFQIPKYNQTNFISAGWLVKLHSKKH